RRTDRLRRHLPGEIDHRRLVDGHQLLDAGDARQVVHPFDVVQLDARVLRTKVEVGAGYDERTGGHTRAIRLLTPGGHAALHQLYHGRNENFRVDAEIVFLTQVAAHRR